jgi:hypothetical protein
MRARISHLKEDGARTSTEDASGTLWLAKTRSANKAACEAG